MNINILMSKIVAAIATLVAILTAMSVALGTVVWMCTDVSAHTQ